MDKFFKIKNYPYDIYTAVGQIIKTSQEWEAEFKRLAQLLNISAKNVNVLSLNKLNNTLNREKRISKKEYEDLKRVVDIRNYINHEFFLMDFKQNFDTYEERIEHLEARLNEAQFYIFEATDLIMNKIDIIEGNTSLRPTVFD